MSKTHLCPTCQTEVAGVCEDCLEKAVIQNQANFGTPDYYICGYCGAKFSQEGFLEHLDGCEWDHKEEFV